MRTFRRSTVLAASLLAISAGLPAHADDGGNGIKHVLLISIDGMHALDFINCAQGISGVNGGAPYCPNLAALAETGVNYLDTSTSKPSDSFPGLMALVSGGSPRTVGAFYDVAYDRSLDPPATTTGNGVAGAPGLCTSGAPPSGTTTEFDEGIEILCQRMSKNAILLAPVLRRMSPLTRQKSTLFQWLAVPTVGSHRSG